MTKTINIESIVDQVIHGLPKGLAGFRSELKQHIRPVIESTLERAGLVTREVFDSQVRVLQQTRMQLETLQQKLDELERESNA